MSEIPFEILWEDRDVRYDIPFNQLRTRAGENRIETLDFIEDTKANMGSPGRMIITNLRLIWHSTVSKANLSIGYNCVVGLNVKRRKSTLQGLNEALYVLAKGRNTRYEFIFTNLKPNRSQIFSPILAVLRAYETSKLYRELKLRGAFIYNKTLKLLPLEQIYDRIPGVWNLSSDLGTLGTFLITNVRLVWHADLNDAYNASIPYLQMKAIAIRNHPKFGLALVVESTKQSGGYILGFRIDPKEKLQETMKQIQNLMKVFSTWPIFGVEFKENIQIDAPEDDHMLMNVDEDIEIVESDGASNAVTAYFVNSQKEANREPLYNPSLGLAMEKFMDGVTMKDLWEVIPPNST